MLTKELENQKKKRFITLKKQLKNNRDKIFVTEDLTYSVRYNSSQKREDSVELLDIRWQNIRQIR